VIWWPMGHSTHQSICRHCKEPFCPNLRNRTRQHFCYKSECRKARKTTSHKTWLAKNPDYFKGKWNVRRVQEWRKMHPRFSQRSKGSQRASESLHFRASTAAPEAQPQPPLQDLVQPLQDSIMRNPLIIGLIAHVFGCSLQDDIEAQSRRLIMLGMEIQHSTAAQESRSKTTSMPECGQSRPLSQT
jgi:hypothetical protein